MIQAALVLLPCHLRFVLQAALLFIWSLLTNGVGAFRLSRGGIKCTLFARVIIAAFGTLRERAKSTARAQAHVKVHALTSFY